MNLFRRARKKKILLLIGVAFVLLGVLYNEWVIRTIFEAESTQVPFRFKPSMIFNLLLILMGGMLVAYRQRIVGKRREIVVFLVTFALCLLLAEVGIRIFHKAKYTNPIVIRSASEELGWKTDENVTMSRGIKGYGEVNFATQKYGFRTFGQRDTEKTKIFAVGDSFTEAYQVSDGYAYYDALNGENPCFEIFAYGCAGYSSLQEFLILDRYFERIEPDIVLWQFCSNDILENRYELDLIDLHDARETIRPYYVNGEIVMRSKKREKKAFSSSVMLQKLNLLGRLFWKEEDSVRDPELHAKAVRTTREIMGLVKQRVGKRPVVAFCVDTAPWENHIFSEICGELGIHYIKGIPEAIRDAKASGVIVDGTIYDSHWNKTGHAIAGEMIRKYLEEKDVIKKRDGDGT